MKTLKLIFLCVFALNATLTRTQDIFSVIEKNNLEQVKALVESDLNLVTLKDDAGDTPLHHAAWQKQPETILYLISKGADVNSQDINLRTPLHLSALSGSIECTKLLIDKGANIKLADYRDQMPLHYAAQNGQKEIAEVLIKAGSPLDAKNSYGRTPLLLCCRERGTPELAQLLINAGSDVNAKDNFESTPLELAAWRGYKGIVGILIKEGAEIPVKGRRAQAIFASACQKGLTELFSKQVEKGIEIPVSGNQPGTLLHDAAKGGSPEIVEILIKKGLKAGSKDIYGWTPLHYAAMNNHAGVVKTLLNNGVDINGRNIMGQTAFNIAGEYAHTEIQNYLAVKGADQSPLNFPVLKGEYLGQTLPDTTPEIFARGIISSIWGLHSSLAFSPDGNEVYWSPMIEIPGQVYSISPVYYMKRVNDIWTPPQVASFSGAGEADDGEPFFSPDGKRIYFNSSRPNPLQDNKRKENVWYTDKTADGWSDPRPLDQVINKMNMHWQFSVDRQGNLYFASDNAGGFGMHDIYCSCFKDGKYQEPVNLGNKINTASTDHTPYISPDGDYLVYCCDMELRIAFRNGDGSWGESKSMGNPINTGFEICPMVTPDGRYIVFLSGREGESHPFWVSASIIEDLRTSK